jgi:hypothetical protein
MAVDHLLDLHTTRCGGVDGVAKPAHVIVAPQMKRPGRAIDAFDHLQKHCQVLRAHIIRQGAAVRGPLP